MSDLLTCLERINSGDWTFLQLRGKPFGQDDINAGDIDLLGNADAIANLLTAALSWAKEGLCHVHILQRKKRKTEFSLFSHDGRERLQFDLWLHLPQVDHGRVSLTFEDCQDHFLETSSHIKRLPLELEAALYLQHLVCKKKDLTQPRYQQFLRYYSEQLHHTQQDALAAAFDLTISSQAISAHSQELSSTILSRALSLSISKNRTNSSLSWQESLLRPSRKSRTISIMGCDGAGKTSLAKRLVTDSSAFSQIFTGKHLYRKSYLYKAAVIFIRPLTFQSREKFDELIGPACYLRACLGLRIKLARWKSQGTLLDRNLIDFLFLDRKSDQPRFSRFLFLHQLCGVRIPVIHCVADFETIQSRKDEMTQVGHTVYDAQMSSLLSTRCPTDYLCFNNAGKLDDASEALQSILHTLAKSD